MYQITFTRQALLQTHHDPDRRSTASAGKYAPPSRLVLLFSPCVRCCPPSTKVETLRSSLAAADAERLGLEARSEEALRHAETASRGAEAEAEALRASLEAAGRDAAAAAEERLEYGNEMEVLYWIE